MSWTELARLALGHAGGAAWAMFVGALLWGLAGVVAIVVAYRVARRFRALDLPDGRRWPRLVFGLLLVFITLPMIAGAGVITGLRDEARGVIRTEVATPAARQALGDLLLAPVLHVRPGDELDFLLVADERRRALDQVTAAIVGQAEAELPSGPDHAAWRWLRARAEERLLHYIADHRDRYDALFEDLHADDAGRLSRASAAQQVGQAFIAREIDPPLADAFDGVRLQLLFGATVPPLLALLAFWLLAWRQRRARSTNPPT